MVSIQTIKQRIAAVIDREIEIAKREAAEFEQKKYDNEYTYGLGGWYRQFEKAQERRKEHIKELEALKVAQGAAVILENLKLYPFYCPDCQHITYLEDSRVKHYMNETIDCPLCTRPIYRSAQYVEWKVQKGSRYAQIHKKG